MLVAGLLLGTLPARAQDLPGPSSRLQFIPRGSLVIPMDNAKQSLTPPFNLRAYGLVNDLLQNNIPVKWAIRAGKAKDGTDFTAEARRVSPSTLSAAVLTFSGGPFIVHKSYAAQALARVAAFGGNVAVYELTRDTIIDIRHDLTFKPRAFVNSTNSTIATNVLNAAGIANYAVGNDFTLLSGSCYTLAMEPHNDNTSGVAAIRAFITSGGNFLAQCRSVDTYENHTNGRFLTTLGVTDANVSNTLSYPNPDLPFSQFVGTLEPAPGGSHQDWRLLTGSTFQNSGHIHADNVGASPARYAALASKLFGGQGGMSFYLGGHDWRNGSTLAYLNGQRMMLNALMTPPTRPASCGLSIALPDLTIAKSHVGSFISGATGTYTITVSNVGAAATIDTIVVTDTLPSGLTYVTGSGTGWTVTAVGQVVTARYPGVLGVSGNASFQFTVGVGTAAVPAVTNRAHVSGGGEVNLANNTAADPTVVLRGYDLAVSSSATPEPVAFTSTLTYVVRVVNRSTGAGTATGVTLTDSLPAGVSLISAVPSQGSCGGTSVQICGLGALANGDSATVTISARVVATGTLTNVARVSLAEADPDSTNNRTVTVSTAIPATVRDAFAAVSYAGNAGTHSWLAPWAESGETTDPTAGVIRVDGSGFCASGNCLAIGGSGANIADVSVTRGADLSAATSAMLSFSYRRQALGPAGGSVLLQASGNGGATWTTLRTFAFGGSTDAAQQPRSCDLTPYIGADTRIRFVGVGSAVATVLHVDDIQIEYSDQPPAASGCVSLAATQLGFLTNPTDTEVDRVVTPAVQVAIQNDLGETVAGATNPVTLTIATNPGGGVLFGTTTVNAVNGVATFTNLSIDLVGSGYTLEASSGALAEATSTPFAITAGCYGTPGGGPVTYHAFTEAKARGSATSLTLPTACGVSAGNLLIAAVVTDGNTTASLSAPPGWTLLDLGQQSGEVTLGVWWKLASAGEPASHQFTWAGGEDAYGWMMRFSGHDATNPINAWVAAGVAGTTAPTSPAVTTTLDSTLIVRLGSFDGPDISTDDPGLAGHVPITMDRSGTSTGGPTSGGAGYALLPTTGASGTSTFALTASHAARLLTLAIAPADTVPPAAVTNLATQFPLSTSIGLTWTAPGDNGSVGQATSYAIRYSTSPITDATWNTATAVSGVPAPQPAGAAESFTVTGLTPGTTYYFAIRTTDDRGNVSALSNVATAATTTCGTVTTVAMLRTQIADPACTTINVAPGTYLLTSSGSGPLDIRRNVTIQRAGVGEVVLDANNATAVVDITEDRAVTLIGLTIQRGQRDDGAGIRANKGNITLRVVNTTVRNNTGKNGAGIFSKSPVILERSTISGNVAPDNGGAGVFIDGGSLTCTNSTISGNTAQQKEGGGVHLKGGAVATFTNCTIANNQAQQGGGIWHDGSSLTLRNTIVADNIGTTSNNQIGKNAVISNGYNLVEGGCSGCTATDLTADPQLGSLANNGGDTFTHALLAGSPAIDAALPADAPATDQRGVSRPLGLKADIGAYEYEPPVVGVGVTPDGAQNLSQLPSNGSSYTATFTVTNTGNGTSTYGLKVFGGAAASLTVLTLNGVAGDTTNTTLAAGASMAVVVEYTVGVVAAGTPDTLSLRATTVGASDSGFVDLTVVRPDVQITRSVTPAGVQPPGTDLTYEVTVTNAGSRPAVSTIAIDSLATPLQFRVGSVVNTLPPGMTVSVEYSSDGGASWSYSPIALGCGAPAGYDGCVNRIRWTLLSNLGASAPDNEATFRFVARIK